MTDSPTHKAKRKANRRLAGARGSSAGETHDYTKRYWGHDYTFEPIANGKRGHMMGWGHGIEAGDFLIIQNGDGSTRYKVDAIKYMLNPRDMWSADVTFAPRSQPPNGAHQPPRDLDKENL